jgi:hypothetical protein
MKTVEFIKDDGIHFQHYRVNTKLRTDHSGTYVLASDANERIKVLEDALKFYQYAENYKSTAPVARGDGSYDYDVPVLIDNGEIARAAINYKQPG